MVLLYISIICRQHFFGFETNDLYTLIEQSTNILTIECVQLHNQFISKLLQHIDPYALVYNSMLANSLLKLYITYTHAFYMSHMH